MTEKPRPVKRPVSHSLPIKPSPPGCPGPAPPGAKTSLITRRPPPFSTRAYSARATSFPPTTERTHSQKRASNDASLKGRASARPPTRRPGAHRDAASPRSAPEQSNPTPCKPAASRYSSVPPAPHPISPARLPGGNPQASRARAVSAGPPGLMQGPVTRPTSGQLKEQSRVMRMTAPGGYLSSRACSASNILTVASSSSISIIPHPGHAGRSAAKIVLLYWSLIVCTSGGTPHLLQIHPPQAASYLSLISPASSSPSCANRRY